MIFTDYWKGLVLNFSVVGNTVLFESSSWWKGDIYWLLRSSSFELFGDGKYGLLSTKTLMERWYLHGLLELSIIFQDLWITLNQSSYILFKIRKSETVTRIFYNIDSKNKNLQRTETNHTNSILVLKCNATEDLAKINLKTRYDFDRKKLAVLQNQAPKFA